METFKKIRKRINRLTKYVGFVAGCCAALLVLITVYDVGMRYLLNSTSAAYTDMEWHLFSLIFLLGGAYALQEDAHVRVDVFYNAFSDKKKAWVNLVGILLFLLPFAFVILWHSISFVQFSYQLNESAVDPGGLPYRFLIKSALSLSFFLLILQAFSMLIKCVLILRGDTSMSFHSKGVH